jgi:hypothetical protein
MAQDDVWQEASAACHPDIAPVALHSRRGFRALLKDSQQQCSAHLPPASSLAAEQLVPVTLPVAAAAAAVPPTAPAAPQHPGSPLQALGAMVGALLGFQ